MARTPGRGLLGQLERASEEPHRFRGIPAKVRDVAEVAEHRGERRATRGHLLEQCACSIVELARSVQVPARLRDLSEIGQRVGDRGAIRGLALFDRQCPPVIRLGRGQVPALARIDPETVQRDRRR